MTRDFIWRLEDVLDLYAEPYDPLRPVVCVDELPYQLLSNVAEDLPGCPGKPRRFDYEYVREGTCSIFLAFEPQAGWRSVEAKERRTSKDFASFMRALAQRYPDALTIRVVLDNLNTHSPAAFYQAFNPVEARRLTERFAFHYTPTHGSWLNQAEIEFSVMARQCLKRRLESVERVNEELSCWEKSRNLRRAGVDWRFTTGDARVRLARLYPHFES